MHHSDTPIPGAASATLVLVGTGAFLAAFLVGSLAGLSFGVGWLLRLF